MANDKSSQDKKFNRRELDGIAQWYQCRKNNLRLNEENFPEYKEFIQFLNSRADSAQPISSAVLYSWIKGITKNITKLRWEMAEKLAGEFNKLLPEDAKPLALQAVEEMVEKFKKQEEQEKQDEIAANSARKAEIAENLAKAGLVIIGGSVIALRNEDYCKWVLEHTGLFIGLLGLVALVTVSLGLYAAKACDKDDENHETIGITLM
jgi:predicted RND superfamily exporter protein